jgi:hypothetical protein
MKRAFLFSLCLFSSFLFAQNRPAPIQNLQAVAAPALYSYLFWDVYSAQLFTPKGSYDESIPLALKLNYQIDLKGKAIAERSISEMKKQGLLDTSKAQSWYEQLAAIIPDVAEGDEIVGHVDEQGKTAFFYNGQRVGEIDDAEFSKRFFDIWLGDKTSEPKLRLALLGKSKEKS